jgi:hypothetical protein
MSVLVLLGESLGLSILVGNVAKWALCIVGKSAAGWSAGVVGGWIEPRPL